MTGKPGSISGSPPWSAASESERARKARKGMCLAAATRATAAVSMSSTTIASSGYGSGPPPPGANDWKRSIKKNGEGRGVGDERHDAGRSVRRRPTSLAAFQAPRSGEARHSPAAEGVGAVPAAAEVDLRAGLAGGIGDANRRALRQALPRARRVLDWEIRVERHVARARSRGRIPSRVHRVRVRLLGPMIRNDHVSDVVVAAADAGEDDT